MTHLEVPPENMWVQALQKVETHGRNFQELRCIGADVQKMPPYLKGAGLACKYLSVSKCLYV